MAYNEPIEEIYEQQDRSRLILPTTKKDDYGLVECFPNPSANLINFRYKLPDNNFSGTINIYDNIGKLIKSINLGTSQGIETFSMEKYSSGLYYYTLIVNKTTIAKDKFIINK